MANATAATNQQVIAVRMLGGFSITASSTRDPFGSDDTASLDIAGRARRVWLLIAYLIAHRDRAIATSELIDLLWTEDQARQNPAKTLQHNVSRARDLLEQLGLPGARTLIVGGSSCYRWNPDVKTVIDVEEFESLLNQAKEARSEAARRDTLERAVKLYRGDVLPGLENEAWVARLGVYVRSLFESASLMLARIYSDSCKYEQVASVCERSLRYASASEELCALYITALSATGHPERAVTIYENMCRELDEQRKGAPSEQLEEAYREACRALGNETVTLDGLCDMLAEPISKAAAQYCSWQAFVSMVQREARNAERAQKDSVVMLISAPDEQILRAAEGVLVRYLRTGDAYTSVASSQFAILLHELGEENAEETVSRVLSHCVSESDIAEGAVTISWITAKSILE